MDDYISRAAALKALEVSNVHHGIISALQENVRDIPAADVVEELRKRIDYLMYCIYAAIDALDRGVDNEWARAALEKAEEVVDHGP